MVSSWQIGRQENWGGRVSNPWLNLYFVLNVNLGVFVFAFPLTNYRAG